MTDRPCIECGTRPAMMYADWCRECLRRVYRTLLRKFLAALAIGIAGALVARWMS